MDRGEQILAELPLGSAPASSRALAHAQCWFTRETKRGVWALTSRHSTSAPADRRTLTQSTWPAEKNRVMIETNYWKSAASGPEIAVNHMNV